MHVVPEEQSPVNLTQQIRELAPWFHNLHLPDGTQTFPDHFLGDFPSFKWQQVADALPADLTGWSVLDIGCNAGFYSFEIARRGAVVTGIDSDEHYLRQARWGARVYGLENQVRFLRMQVYDLVRLAETFDLVLFLGVLYHLRYPLLALDIVARKVKRLLLAQTLMTPGREVYPYTEDGWINERDALTRPGWPRLAFIEHRFAGDPTNWWIPNYAGMAAMLRSSGMRVLGTPADEFYLCEPDPDSPSCTETWNSAEFISATGLQTGES